MLKALSNEMHFNKTLKIHNAVQFIHHHLMQILCLYLRVYLGNWIFC